VKTSRPDVFGVDFAIKPGETRIDVTYATPYARGTPYQGRILTKDDDTYLIAPSGIEMKGEGLTDLGPEPRTQARIYGLAASAYKIELSGEAAHAPSPETAEQEDSGPQIQQILPRINRQAALILALALGILALGFVLLYRAGSPQPSGAQKETDERGRR
jgi:hypothetical protein